MDANKDGTIDAEEWDKFMTPELKAAIEGKLSDTGLVAGFKPLVDIARVFDQLDTDKSGDLSRDQFNLDKLLEAMDTDANGSISIEEFKNGLPKEVLQTMSSKLNEKGLIEGI